MNSPLQHSSPNRKKDERSKASYRNGSGAKAVTSAGNNNKHTTASHHHTNDSPTIHRVHGSSPSFKMNSMSSIGDQCRKTAYSALKKSEKKKSRPPIPPSPDRYVPSRSTKKTTAHAHTFDSNSLSQKKKESIEMEYDRYLWESISTETIDGTIAASTPKKANNTLQFGSPSPTTRQRLTDPFSHDHLRNIKVRAIPRSAARTTFRFPPGPKQILDAVGILDDFYTDVLDWSQLNLVAVALRKAVYVWDPTTKEHGVVFELNEGMEGFVSHVKWCPLKPQLLAIGYRCTSLNRNMVSIVDTAAGRELDEVHLHSPVSSMDWNGKLLTAGCECGTVYTWEGASLSVPTCVFRNTTSKVCGTKWHKNSVTLAVGSNCNVVRIWDARWISSPCLDFREHDAAVKALSWCPHQSEVIVTGGGCNDQTIRVWDSQTGLTLRSVKAHNQISTLEWTPGGTEVISCHGFSDNSVAVWNYSSFEKKTSLKSHNGRILSSAVSPSGCTLATVGADELLCFWQIGHETPGVPLRSTLNSPQLKASPTIR